MGSQVHSTSPALGSQLDECSLTRSEVGRFTAAPVVSLTAEFSLNATKRWTRSNSAIARNVSVAVVCAASTTLFSPVVARRRELPSRVPSGVPPEREGPAFGLKRKNGSPVTGVAPSTHAAPPVTRAGGNELNRTRVATRRVRARQRLEAVKVGARAPPASGPPCRCAAHGAA
jgi:hypothetical protein